MPFDRVSSLQERQANIARKRERIDSEIRELKGQLRKKRGHNDGDQVAQDLEETLGDLEKKSGQLTARMERLQGRENVEKHKQDTRRKILVGAVILNAVEAGEYPQELLKSLLDRYLTRPADRALFGFKW